MTIALIIIVVLAIIVFGYFISTQRALVGLDELCKNALSQIEVQLNSRFDAVIALAKTAAQYAKHESDTIIQAVQARGGNSGAAANTPAAINEQADLLVRISFRTLLEYVVELGIREVQNRCPDILHRRTLEVHIRRNAEHVT